MPSRVLALFSTVPLVAAAACGPAPPKVQVTIPPPPPGVVDLNSWLEEARGRHGLPGITAAVFNTEGLVAIGAAGTRRVGSGVPLIYTDKLQIASIAKTMTATLIAKLIETGHLSWEARLDEIYPELRATMPAGYRTATIDALLRHSAGVPQWMRNDDIVRGWVREHARQSAPEQRHAAVRYILSHDPLPASAPQPHYTNDSYLILGHIAERVTGRPFEELLREALFGPLGMTGAGFGEAASPDSIDQPWGHVKRGDRFVPHTPVHDGASGVSRIARDDAASFTTPYGGMIHASVVDLAQYGIFHLRGDLGLESWLSTGTFRRLHHGPPSKIPRGSQGFATGFFNEGAYRADRRWTNVQHWGYYARGRTLLWFSPQANVGAVVLTNGTDEDEVMGMRPISEVVIGLYKRFGRPEAEPASGGAAGQAAKPAAGTTAGPRGTSK